VSSKNKSIVTGCVVLTIIIGTLNNVYKRNSLPGLRFYFGSGIMWLFLVGLGEFEEEVSKTLALAVATFVVIGEGGGMLDGFLGTGASKTALNTQPSAGKSLPMAGGGGHVVPAAFVTRDNTGINAPGRIFTTPVKPVIPNSVVI
jgi:hypothetical protein